jgi:hypothetical protein
MNQDLNHNRFSKYLKAEPVPGAPVAPLPAGIDMLFDWPCSKVTPGSRRSSHSGSEQSRQDAPQKPDCPRPVQDLQRAKVPEACSR